LYDLSYAVVELDKPEAPRVVRETYEALKAEADKDPNHERVRFYLCDLLLNLDYEGYNRPEEAKKYAREMIAAHPDNPNGYDFVAQAELRLKNVQGAVEAYRQAKVALNKVDSGEAGRKFNAFYDAKIAELEKLL
jgi:predicted Zn-dependent protease